MNIPVRPILKLVGQPLHYIIFIKSSELFSLIVK